MKTKIVLFIFTCIILFIICPSYKFSKHQIPNCGMLTVLTYKSVFTKKVRTYFIAGEYNKFRLPKNDCFYSVYSGFDSGYMVLCSCKDNTIIINYKDGSFRLDEIPVSDYSTEKIKLERISYSLFDNLVNDSNYILISESLYQH